MVQLRSLSNAALNATALARRWCSLVRIGFTPEIVLGRPHAALEKWTILPVFTVLCNSRQVQGKGHVACWGYQDSAQHIDPDPNESGVLRNVIDGTGTWSVVPELDQDSVAGVEESPIPDDPGRKAWF